MSNTTFEFKQFKIKQDKCAMKVGTDSVLLGAWSQLPKECEHILDIGTGTGILALMLAQKTKTNIDAIEVDRSAVEQALENVKLSPFKDQITVYHKSLQSFAKEIKTKYDLIVSNPPYFIDSSKAPEESRNLARHNDHLSFEELLIGINKLLRPSGEFCLILPTKEGDQFNEQALSNGFFCIKRTSIKTKPNKAPKRLLLRYSSLNQPIITDEIIIEQNARHEYSQEYISLTKDYYIGF